MVSFALVSFSCSATPISQESIPHSTCLIYAGHALQAYPHLRRQPSCIARPVCEIQAACC